MSSQGVGQVEQLSVVYDADMDIPLEIIHWGGGGGGGGGG